MVFEIPCPSAGKLGSTRFDKLKLTLPEITDLPYVNVTHFERLLYWMEPNDIVRTFTSLLLEERVLLIMDNKEDLLPVSYALQSLIYPFELTILIPYLANDGYDDDVSNFNHVTQPYSYLIGIEGRDKETALRILKEEIETDDRTSPIIIDLTSAHKSSGKEPILIIPKAKGFVVYPSTQSAVQTEELPKYYIKDNSLPRDEEQTLRYALQKAKNRI